MPDEGKVAQQCVLALKEITHDHSACRRRGCRCHSTNGPAHGVSVSRAAAGPKPTRHTWMHPHRPGMSTTGRYGNTRSRTRAAITCLA